MNARALLPTDSVAAVEIASGAEETKEEDQDRRTEGNQNERRKALSFILPFSLF